MSVTSNRRIFWFALSSKHTIWSKIMSTQKIYSFLMFSEELCNTLVECKFTIATKWHISSALKPNKIINNWSVTPSRNPQAFMWLALLDTPQKYCPVIVNRMVLLALEKKNLISDRAVLHHWELSAGYCRNHRFRVYDRYYIWSNLKRWTSTLP